MTVRTSAGTKYSIGPAIEGAFPTTATAYAALTPYVVIGEVEDGGEYGDDVGSTEFVSLGDRRLRRLKTTFDAGELTIIVGNDAADVGQSDLFEAIASDFNFAFKVENNDKLTTSGTNSIDYFSAMVAGGRKQVGTADNVVRRTFRLLINSPIVTVAAT